jgi:predicted ATPase/class 3 adenylate cyclase
VSSSIRWVLTPIESTNASAIIGFSVESAVPCCDSIGVEGATPVAPGAAQAVSARAASSENFRNTGRTFAATINGNCQSWAEMLGMASNLSAAPLRPSGTVTLLFTDIEGSTRRWERHGEAMGAAVRQHDDLLRAAIESHGGYVFKTSGDMFCAAFTRTGEAVAAAVDVQRAMEAADFSAVEGMRVRVALHAGTCEERDGDYFGPSVNRVARLLSIAHGGQIVLSGAVAELAYDELPQDCATVDYGQHRLKDLSHPEHVFGLVADGLRGEFPPLRSLSMMANNLPRYLTPIIGREREIDEMTALLRESQVVTIVGAGGIGKTRTAVQVAAHAIDGTGDGVWFVDLAPISDPDLIASTVAGAIGAELPPNQDLTTALVTMLKPLHLLIVLDNCEHVLARAAALTEQIARACPRVGILATSRESLNVAGEVVYRLDTLDADSAVALFVSRAQQADQRFALAAGEASTVTDICRRLDGIALAIELAAARAHVMPLDVLLRGLDERFNLLPGGKRTALPRQQTMRALIDWSYDLLSDEERAVFRRLGVFAGGFTLEAAAAVVNDGPAEPWGIIEQVAALVEKSLVSRDAGSHRYQLFESTRHYALHRLGEASEAERVRRAHGAYFGNLAASAAASVGRPGESEDAWLARYEPDLDNFRVALDWALVQDVDLAARIVGDLLEFWFHDHLFGEGLRWSEAALAALGDGVDEPIAAPVWIAIAQNAARVGAYPRGLEAGERSLAIARRVGDPGGIAEALYVTCRLLRRRRPGARQSRIGRSAADVSRVGKAALHHASACVGGLRVHGDRSAPRPRAIPRGARSGASIRVHARGATHRSQPRGSRIPKR